MDNIVIKNSGTLTPIMFYPSKISYLKCRNCRSASDCPYFENIYKRYFNQAKELILPEVKKIDEKIYYEYIDKAQHHDLIEQRIKKQLSQDLLGCSEVCVYEINRAQTIYEEFDNSYDLNYKPILKNLVLTLISQLLIQLRLQRTTSQSDILTTNIIATKQGPVEIEVITPGLSYMMTANREVVNTLERINNIIEPLKIEVKGELTIKDIMTKILDLPHNKK